MILSILFLGLAILFLGLAIFCGFKWLIHYICMMSLICYLDVSGVEFDMDTFRVCCKNEVERMSLDRFRFFYILK